MKPCPYCGHEVLRNDRYCPDCGHVRKAPISLDKYNLGMIENFKQCLVYKYADFEGRASRSEYWNFFLMYQLLFVAILFTCAFLSYISPLSSAVGVGFGLVIRSPTVRSNGYPWRSRCSASLARPRSFW